jgi:hypothetical protein
MDHSFNINVAKKLGIASAVILNNLYWWIDKNRANDKHFHDGYYWTYNSRKAFVEQFPYLTERQIEYALRKLIDGGYVITGNYNKASFDRTLWYAITKEGYCILQNCEMEETKVLNANNRNVEPIPDINTDITTLNKPDIRAPKKEMSNKYGEYKNVLLSDTDLAKLKSEFPNDWEERIERLSAYIASTGKSYKSHLATIRNWARRNSEARKKTSRNESHWQKTEEEKQDEEAWMRNVIQC